VLLFFLSLVIAPFVVVVVVAVGVGVDVVVGVFFFLPAFLVGGNGAMMLMGFEDMVEFGVAIGVEVISMVDVIEEVVGVGEASSKEPKMELEVEVEVDFEEEEEGEEEEGEGEEEEAIVVGD
jgi:hypothetical protein